MNNQQIRKVSWSLILASGVSGLEATIISTAAPAIVSKLNGIEFMGWIVAIFLLAIAVSTPLWNELGERLGSKNAFLIAMIIFIIGSIMGGLAINIYFFIFARAIMGIGAGGIGALPYIIVGKIYPNLKERTKNFGYLAASFSIASIMGPIIGGILVDFLGWSWVFYINLPLGVIPTILMKKYYKEEQHKKTGEFDRLGSVLLILGLTLFISGIQLFKMIDVKLVLIVISLGILSLVGLIFVEKKATNPIIPLQIFKNRELVLDFWIFSLSWGAFIAFNIYAPLWVQGLLGTSALIGGMVLIPNSIADLIATQVAPSFQIKFHTKKALNIGLISIFITLFSLIFCDRLTNIWIIMLIGSFSGFGVGLVFVILQVKVQADARDDELGIATSLSYLVRILAQTFTGAFYGILLNTVLIDETNSRTDVSLEQLNKLNNLNSLKEIPKELLPTLREILHQGLILVMGCAVIFIVFAIIVNRLSKNTDNK